MRLLVESVYVNEVGVCRCRGQIVCGAETQLLEDTVRGHLRMVREVVLHLGEVERIDSSGLGLLVRLLAAARSGGGDLKLAAAPAQITKLLETMNLTRVLEVHASEQEALAALSRARKADVPRSTAGPRVLCVDSSCDLLAFVRTVLAGGGYVPITTDNLPDAKLLLKATRPSLVITGPNVDSRRAADLLGAASGVSVLALPAEFQYEDADAAGTTILNQVRAALARDAAAAD